MVFTSEEFLLFLLPALILCYFLIPQRFIQARNFVLFVFSVAFYGWGGTGYLALFAASMVTNYVGGLMVGHIKGRGGRRIALIATLAVNLGMLGVFKYAGFVTGMLCDAGIMTRVISFALPIGISFYTFQGLSYVVDVYRGDAEVQNNPLNVSLYIALFPQLVAGPIVRYTDVERELSLRSHTLNDFSTGVTRFMLGFGKKMIMANPMGEIADKVFSAAGGELLTTPLAWVGAVSYAMQIYFDFSAYSDMAIGLGRMFGFRFNENFNYPYVSATVTEFWRRWHISLSTWFRDYVYIPLGGNRCSVGKHILNLAVVWFLTGLWHGAAWTFILWGVYYGVLLILEKYVFGGVMKYIPKVVGHILTMFIVLIGWVIFRSDTVGDAVRYVLTMLGAGSADPREAYYLIVQYLPEFLICFVGIFPVKRLLEKLLTSRSDSTVCVLIYELAPKFFAIAVFLLSYMKLVSGSFNPFIYFRF